MTFSIIDKVRESNRIEGILRDPTEAELNRFEDFLELPEITVMDLVAFVKVYQPGAILRDRVGLDVRIGSYYPPSGGPEIVDSLRELLQSVAMRRLSPWEAHIQYESLHPFTDGNGRSGRMLWYWMMRYNRLSDLGFLHAFYYQTLSSTPRLATD